MQPLKDGDTVLTRQALYERVWASPVSALALEFGISDKGLAKVCIRHKIPRPPLGYWAKATAGQRTRKLPLPVNIHENLERVIIRRTLKQEPKELRESPPDIVVPAKLASPHPLISQTLLELEKARNDDYGRLRPANQNCLQIQVSRNALKRAVRIFDTLIKYWESTGGKVLITEKGKRHDKPVTVFVWDKDETPVRLFEKITRTANPEFKDGDSGRKYLYPLLGRLGLEIHSGGDHRTLWFETKLTSLESHLGRFVVELRDILREARLRRLDRECDKQKRESLAAFREAEELRRNALIADVSAWKQAEDIRQYLASLEHLTHVPGTASRYDTSFEDWLRWAQNYADECDPRTKTNAATVAKNTPIAEVDLPPDTK